MTEIIYKTYTFSDDDDAILEASGALHQSLISTELSADDFTFSVRYNGDLSDFENFEYAEPAYLYEDDELIYKFFITDIAPEGIEQDGTVHLKFTGVSMVGLLISQKHRGGMYNDANVRDVIADIMQAELDRTEGSVDYYETASGLTYSVDRNVGLTRVDGRLKIASARDNLRDLLAAYGVSILKASDGSLRFTYNQQDSPVGISADKIYMGDHYAKSERVTAVQVIEHAFYQVPETEEKVLYDSTVEYADHFEIVFNEPYYDLRSSGLTLHGSNCNYAIVSGTGILYGKPYTHSRHLTTQSTELSGEENIKSVEDIEIVTALNSSGLLDRLANYYASAKDLNSDFVLEDGVRTGSLVSLLDPLGRQKTGYVSELKFNISGFIKAMATIVTNWVPISAGNNYTVSTTLTGVGTYTVPSGVSKMRVVLIQGGSGGYGGYKGGDGEGSRAFDEEGRNAGLGGNGGEGGAPGKVFSLDLNVQPGQTFSYSVGSGGGGGAKNHGQGSPGTHSTFGEYSSADGNAPESGFLNIITNILYATQGPSGLSGGRGQDQYNNAEGCSYGGQTWSAGAYGGQERLAGGTIFGGGGGGAAIGSDGSDGSEGYYTSSTSGPHVYAGDGGDGGNAALFDSAQLYGCGGIGGNGGGGGGVGGPRSTVPTASQNYPGTGGSGGEGSVGGDGGSGVIFVIY